MSIGSETDGGASAIRVTDLSIDGADNGMRIKSNSTAAAWCMTWCTRTSAFADVANPIHMDTHYSFKGPEQNKIPVFNDITLRNVRILDGGKITLDGFDAAHKLEMKFDNVIGDARGTKISDRMRADVGPGPMNLPVAGENVTVTGAQGAGSPNSCVNKFVPFPGRQ